MLSRPRTLAVCLALLVFSVASARADLTPQWSDDELERFAVAILTGRVVDISSGRDPATNAIHTYVTLSVQDVFKGDVPERTVTLKQLGGRLGDEALAVAGQAIFTPGEDVLLFLEARPRDRTVYTAALWQGKWTIQHDATSGDRIAVRTHPGQSDRGPLGGEPERRLLSTFATHLRAISAARNEPQTGSRGFATAPSAEEMTGTTHAASTGTTDAPFTLQRYRWNEFDTRTAIPVDIEAGGMPGLPGGGTNEIIRAASLWSGPTGLAFVGGGSGTRCFGGASNGHISISFTDPCGEMGSASILDTYGVSSTTTGGRTVNGISFRRVIAGYIEYNGNRSSSVFLKTSNCFASLVARHFGTVLGLGSSADPTAIMFPSLSSSRCSAAPVPMSADDLAGITAIYPPTTTTSAPGPPSGLVTSASGSTVTLAWNAPTTGGAPTAYIIEAGSASALANLANFSTGNTATTFSASGVGSGSYFLRVKATNAAGTSAASNESMLVVGGGCSGPPGPPTALTIVSNSGGTVVLAWNAASGNPTSYIVEAGSTSGASNLANSDLGSSATSLTAVNVGRGTYFVRVRGKNTCGTGPASNEITLLVP